MVVALAVLGVELLVQPGPMRALLGPTLTAATREQAAAAADTGGAQASLQVEAEVDVRRPA